MLKTHRSAICTIFLLSRHPKWITLTLQNSWTWYLQPTVPPCEGQRKEAGESETSPTPASHTGDSPGHGGAQGADQALPQLLAMTLTLLVPLTTVLGRRGFRNTAETPKLLPHLQGSLRWTWWEPENAKSLTENKILCCACGVCCPKIWHFGTW